MKRSRGKQVLRKIGLTGCMVLIGWLSPGLGTAAVQLVDVCHREADRRFQLVTVPAQVVPVLRAHGDALPGEAVPGRPGYRFNDHCRAILASTCPCACSIGALATLRIFPIPDPTNSCTVILISGAEFIRLDTATMDGSVLVIEVDPRVPSCILSVCNTTNPSCSHTEEVDYITLTEFRDCQQDIRQTAADLGTTCPP